MTEYSKNCLLQTEVPKVTKVSGEDGDWRQKKNFIFVASVCFLNEAANVDFQIISLTPKEEIGEM